MRYSFAVCVVAAGILAPAAVAAPVLSFQPSFQDVNFGQTFSMDVRVSSVSDLFAFQFDIGFDPAILRAVQISEGSFLGQGGPTAFVGGAMDNTAGTISATADTLIGALPGVNGSGVLATVVFTAIGSGTSPVSLTGAILLDSSLHDLVFTTEAGTAVVGIPEPHSMSLLALGFGALAIAGWRRRRSDASSISDRASPERVFARAVPNRERPQHRRR